MPHNVFANDPPWGRYYIWWRPYKVIFDTQKVIEIQRQLDALAPEAAQTVDLSEAFRENFSSAFLPAVLAANPDKGTPILERMLAEYAWPKKLDDRWLLIVAALGRIPTPESERILRTELEQITRRQAWKRLADVVATRAPSRDPRDALIDALVACQAGQGTLSAASIEKLAATPGWFGGEMRAWIWGLDWAARRMAEDAFMSIVEDGLAMCGDDDLERAMNLHRCSERLHAIRIWLSDPNGFLPLVRKFALRDVPRRKVVAEFMRVLYAGVLLSEANSRVGQYTVDAEVVRFFLEGSPATSRSLSQCCRILCECEPSERFPEWEQFLRDQAARIDPRDVQVAEWHLGRIREGLARPEPFKNLTKPGVYMLGFSAPF